MEIYPDGSGIEGLRALYLLCATCSRACEDAVGGIVCNELRDWFGMPRRSVPMATEELTAIRKDHASGAGAFGCAAFSDVDAWRMVSVVTSDEAWVFASERMTPLSKGNCWNRIIHPTLDKVALGWANLSSVRL